MAKFDLDELNKYVKPGGITVEKHAETDLYIFGYTSNVSNTYIKWDDTSIQCRGLIVDGAGNVISRSFKKFFSFKQYINEKTLLLNDGQTTTITNNNFKIFEKIDGSMAILYWIGDTPYLATQRSFKSIKAKKATSILHKKYSHLFGSLDKSKTYIFEAIYPEARVIVDYGKLEELILIGIIDTDSGKVLPLQNIGFPTAKELTNEYRQIEDLRELQALNLRNQEGFVLLYEDDLMIKIKFPWFNHVHSILNKIIVEERNIFNHKQQLKHFLGAPQNILTNVAVWECLKEGNGIEHLRNRLSGFHDIFAVDDWLERKSFEIQSHFNNLDNSTNEEEKWKKVKPRKIEYFDLRNKINQSDSEAIIWNRINRIFSEFD